MKSSLASNQSFKLCEVSFIRFLDCRVKNSFHFQVIVTGNIEYLGGEFTERKILSFISIVIANVVKHLSNINSLDKLSVNKNILSMTT